MRLRDIAMRRAALSPERIAYRFIDGNLEETALLTCAELDEHARNIAAALSQWTRPGARVIIAVDSGQPFVVCLYGCLYAARVAVPAPAPGRGRERWVRLLSVLRDATAELIIVDSEWCRAKLVSEPLAHGCRVATADELLAGAFGVYEPPATTPSLLLLQYTSGSTGRPKGVMLTESSVHANIEAIRVVLGTNADSQSVSWLPVHHDMGLIGSVLHPMQLGFPATLMSPLDFVQRPARWLQAISRYRATISGGPPFAYRACLDRIRVEQLRGVDLSSWKIAFVGAERITASLLERFRERFAPHGLAHSAVRACYGLAEATLMMTCTPARESAPMAADSEANPEASGIASSGRCVPEHELICVDALGKRCSDGVRGEIWVRGPSVAAGYYNRPEDTTRVFGAMCEGRGPYLRTGDLGVMSNEQLFVVGRIKDVAIVRGRKFAPEDLETTIAASHPALSSRTCAAFSAPHGDGEELVIVQELTRSALQSTQECVDIRASMREQLVNMHGVSPAAILLVARGTIPRTTSGKVRRGRCRELFEQGTLARQDPMIAHGNAP